MDDERESAGATEHYFTEQPHSARQRRDLRFLYRGELLRFTVDSGVFAAHGIDPGTALLIENLSVGRQDRVLDLGCGWGAIGIAAAKSIPQGQVILTDVNRRATALARRNLHQNGIRNAEVRAGSLFRPVAGETFDLIATNPPYHVGRETILTLLEGAREALRPGGRLLLVGKGSQGILFYQRWLEQHWPGPVSVLGRGSGYRVLEARIGEPPTRASPPPDSAGKSAKSRRAHRSA
jgi:16S rRNA (guanine1207-N2)-methyltransferase